MRIRPSRYIVIDIETRNLTEQQIAFESQFVKHHPSTKDETKRSAQIESKKAALQDRGALTNSAEIGCIGIMDDTLSAPIVLHTFNFDGKIECIEHQGFENEAEMLKEFCNVLNTTCDEQTHIVLANEDFDLPKLRYAAAIRNNVHIPTVLLPNSINLIYDVLYKARKYFLLGNDFISLDELSTHMKIDSKVVSGKEIPDLIDKGMFAEVITYNAVDVMKTQRAYLTMTCQF